METKVQRGICPKCGLDRPESDGEVACSSCDPEGNPPYQPGDPQPEDNDNNDDSKKGN